MGILLISYLRPRALSGLVVVGIGSVLGGCQSYERAPLDIISHRSTVENRIKTTEPIDAFLDRLTESGNRTPEHFDPNDGLSVAEGEVLALFYNADLRLARLTANVPLANYETAGLWEDPVFGFDGAEVLSSASPFEYGLTLGLTIPISGRLGVAKDRAGAAYAAELKRIVDAEWTTRSRVKSAWATWAVAETRVHLLSEMIEQIEQIGLITDRLEEAGELAHVEARLLRAELLQAHVRQAQAEFTATQARVNLLGLLGLSPTSDIDLIASLEINEMTSSEDELGRLIESNTLLAVRRAEYQIAEETLRLEIRKQYPDITIGGGYGSEDKDDRLLLGLSIPIPIFNANRSGIAQAKVKRDIARTMAEMTFEQLAREIAMTNTAILAFESQLLTFETELVPMLDRQFQDMEQLIDLGEIDILTLLETVSRRFDAKNQLLNLRLALLNAMIERARLLGPDKPRAPAPVDNIPNQTSHRAETIPSLPKEGSR